MVQSLSKERNSHSGRQEIPCPVWNSKNSLPRSQKPTSGPYSEPDEPRPYIYNLFLWYPF